MHAKLCYHNLEQVHFVLHGNEVLFKFIVDHSISNFQVIEQSKRLNWCFGSQALACQLRPNVRTQFKSHGQTHSKVVTWFVLANFLMLFLKIWHNHLPCGQTIIWLLWCPL